MENKEGYNVTRTPVICTCGAHLWDEIEEPDGTTYLMVGDMVVTAIDAGCVICKTEWHWRPYDVRLRRILRKHSTIA